MQITITNASSKDVEAVYQIFSHARSQMTYLPHLHTDEETRNFISGLILQGNVWIAKDGETILGFIEVKDEWVEHLYIDPPAQNKGVGKLLLDKAKEITPSSLTLWVFENNRGAIAFYEREGFHLVLKRDQQNADNEEHLPDRKYVWQASI